MQQLILNIIHPIDFRWYLRSILHLKTDEHVFFSCVQYPTQFITTSGYDQTFCLQISQKESNYYEDEISKSAFYPSVLAISSYSIGHRTKFFWIPLKNILAKWWEEEGREGTSKKQTIFAPSVCSSLLGFYHLYKTICFWRKVCWNTYCHKCFSPIFMTE